MDWTGWTMHNMTVRIGDKQNLTLTLSIVNSYIVLVQLPVNIAVEAVEEGNSLKL